MNQPDLVAAIEPVAEAFERLGVHYAIGGSVASSVHGLARATLDADLIADLRVELVTPFVAALGGAYYADEFLIRGAVEGRTAFNLVHLETMLKVDVFILKDRAFDREVLARVQGKLIETAVLDRPFPVASPEDVILNKLEWFELGERSSERQWGDVLGVLKVQGPKLDLPYLRRWAESLGLAALVEQALTEAGLAAGER